MKDEARSADVPVLTFAECLQKVYHFRYKRLKSGGLLVESPDGFTKVTIPGQKNTLHHSEVVELLEALGFQPDEIAEINAHLGKQDAISDISLKKTLETLDVLSKIPHPRHKQSEETLKWIDELFKRLDAEREEYLKSQNS